MYSIQVCEINIEFRRVCVYNGTFLDKVPLADSHGRRAKRDIVQFVPFRNFINAVVPDGPLSVQQRE